MYIFGKNVAREKINSGEKINKIYNYNNPVDVAEAFLAANKKNEKPSVEVKNNENNDKKFFFKNIIFIK